MIRRWEIEVCTECGARAEESERYSDGPYPVDNDHCPQRPTCGTYGKGLPGAGFKRCPGTRRVTAVEVPLQTGLARHLEVDSDARREARAAMAAWCRTIDGDVDDRWTPGGMYDASTVTFLDRLRCFAFGHDATYGTLFGWCRRCKHTVENHGARRAVLYYGKYHSFPPSHEEPAS